MKQLTPESPEVTYPVYDNMPPGPGSLPPQHVQHHWQVHIEEVDQPERERRLLSRPMELILMHTGLYPPNSHEESLSLLEESRRGDSDAKERLVLHFQRFVIHFAKRAYAQSRRLNVPMEDVVQDGMVGLIRASDKADPDIARKTEGSIASYFAWGIRQHIERGTLANRLIHIPINLHSQARQLVIIDSELQAELGREPTDFEVAERAGMMPSKPVELIGLDEVEEYDEFTGRYSERTINWARSEHSHAREAAARKVSEILAVERPRSSLDSLVLDPKGVARPLHEIYADEESERDLLEEVHRSVLRDRLGKALERLNRREQLILELRYGLDGGEPKTLDESARIIERTRERVRQIENGATRKLKFFSNLRPPEKEEKEIEERSKPEEGSPWFVSKTYADHLALVATYERQGKRLPVWLQDEVGRAEQQRDSNFAAEVLRRRQERAASNAQQNLEIIAEDYLSHTQPESLYIESSRDEIKFIERYNTALKHGGLIEKNRAYAEALRKYGGLAAFMVLFQQRDNMTLFQAWKLARRTLFTTLKNFNYDSNRFADVYCEAVELTLHQ